MESEIVHHFNADISGIDMPTRLNSPFNYTPHPLAVMAAEQVRGYISSIRKLDEELRQGKMLGVLVVEIDEGSCGFIAAYSGSLQQSGLAMQYFVPPVYDLLDAQGYFKQEEAEITKINREIDGIDNDASLATEKAAVDDLKRAAAAEIDEYKHLMAQSKKRRDEARINGNADTAALIKESQFQKAELKRLTKKWNELIDAARNRITAMEKRLADLKTERHQRSIALQHWIFAQFVMLNARGERRNLLEIFTPTPQCVPPAGAGECAAPRLLQYAYQHGLKPLAIAEFWYGAPHGTIVRHDGKFYTACRGKCLPILTFMLQGLDVELDPPYYGNADCKPTVLYEDRWILAVDKPSGLPTVPGRNCGISLLEMMQEQYGEVMNVHRLDMDTSGIVLFARDDATYKKLQAMFANREIAKRYVALLDGLVESDNGVIELPLRADYEHRPMQVVDNTSGSHAVTRYEVIERYRAQNKTLVHFYPLTGRTHQLRVHAAHHKGLNAPIVGDRLYGTVDATRLKLHAQQITFTHPWTNQQVQITSTIDPWHG